MLLPLLFIIFDFNCCPLKTVIPCSASILTLHAIVVFVIACLIAPATHNLKCDVEPLTIKSNSGRVAP